MKTGHSIFGNALPRLAKIARTQARKALQGARKALGPALRSRRRILVALITGTKGKTTTTRMLAHILGQAGHVVGLTTTDGIVIGGKTVGKGDSTGYAHAARVLKDPSITAAVLETARGDLLRKGLYVARCDVAALLNVGREQIGIDGIETLEEMARLKRKVIDAARDTVVLNADDPLCRDLIGDFPAARTAVFSLEPGASVAKQHVANGGVAFCLDESGEPRIVRIAGASSRTVVAIADLPAALGGALRHNIANAMAAAALAEGMGVPPIAVGAALASFRLSVEHLPGRFNILSEHPYRVIVDHAINPPAVEALVASLRNVEVPGRRLCAITSFGNRAGWHFTEIGQFLAQGFDHFVCYETKRFRRGRAPGEVPALLRSGLLEAGVGAQCIDVATGRDDTIRRLTERARPGDLIVILGSFRPDEVLRMRALVAGDQSFLSATVSTA
ncbi:MAG: Mur ligase family protein [Methyloceanibacter sp.]